MVKQIKSSKHPLGDIVWVELINLLAKNFLCDYRISLSQITQLALKTRISKDEMLVIISMFKLINKNSFGYYLNLDLLYKEINPNNLVDINRIKEIFRLLFLTELNTRLQIVYRLYISAFSPTHKQFYLQKTEFLRKLKPIAFQLVKVFELENILIWTNPDNLKKSKSKSLQQLSNFAFHLKRVNFRISFNCNIQCRHCFSFSGPNNKKNKPDDSHMIQIINEMQDLNINNINISGGEPFIYFNTILKLVKEARYRNIKTISICTNGYWANSTKNCENILRKLKKAGFMNNIGYQNDHIRVSAGIFHQEFIPLETILNLIYVYYDFFRKPLIVDFEYFEDHPEEKDKIIYIIRHNKLEGKIEMVFRSNILGIGRGRELSDNLKTKNIERFFRCDKINQIVFNPDGCVKPCCGSNVFNKGLIIGNVYNDNLHVLVKNMQNNPILQFISTMPFRKIYDYLDKQPKAEGYHGLCSICEHAIGDLNYIEQLSQKLSHVQEFYPFMFSGERV